MECNNRNILSNELRKALYEKGFIANEKLIFSSAELKVNELSISMLLSVAIKIIELSLELERHGLMISNVAEVSFGFDEKSKIKFFGLNDTTLKKNGEFDYVGYFKLYLGPVLLVNQYPQLAELIRRVGYVSSGEYLSIKHPLLSQVLTIDYRLEKINVFVLRCYQFLTLSPISYYLNIKSYALFFQSIVYKIQSVVWKTKAKAKIISSKVMLNRIKKYLKGIALFDVNGRWSNYHTDYDLDAIVRDENNWRQYYNNERSLKIYELIECEMPGTLLDLGANQGYFSFLGAKLGYRVKALDYEHGAIDKLYLHLRESDFKYKIRPAVVDFKNLTSKECERFKSETTLALGFLHHMRLVELLSWERIVEVLSSLTESKLIAEFKPGTAARASFIPEGVTHVDDYTIEHFMDALKKKFNKVKLCGTYSQHGDGGERQIVVCEK